MDQVAGAKPGTAARWPILLAVVATSGFLLILAALLYDLRLNIEARARENGQNLARALERDIGRNIEVLNLSLQAVVEGVGRADVMALDPSLRNMILFDRSATASGLGALLVYDAAGTVVADSGSVVPRRIARATDREYFIAQREGDRGLFVSKPYLSRIVDRPVIGLSRRIAGPDGAFGGVALASIEISHITAMLRRLELGPNAAVALIRDDGAVLVRQRGAQSEVGGFDFSKQPGFAQIRTQDAGSLIAVSAVDGTERLVTYMRVAGRPLHIVVAQATGDLYAEWRDKAVMLAIVASVISALLIALTIRLTRELRRRDEAERTLERLNAEFAQLSVTDGLTTLGNRRAFDIALPREIRRARRSGSRLCLLVIDIDFFKRFNDRYGHLAGDAALREVGALLRRVCEADGEGAFRVGGEEFGLILPGSGLRRAMAVADRLLTHLRAMEMTHDASPFGTVTISIGVAEVEDDEAGLVYARADAALYRAKTTGRNQAVAAEPQRIAA